MHFDKPTYKVHKKSAKKDIPKGTYTKCPVTGDSVFTKEIEDNQMVVPKSGHHFPIGARERIAHLMDRGSFVETDASVRSADPLQFVDSASYPARIKKYEKESGLPEAVITGTGKILGIEVSIAVMDFRFCGGTLGSAAGEKITLNVAQPPTATKAGRVIPSMVKSQAFTPVATTFERINVARPVFVTVKMLATPVPTFTAPKAGAPPPLVSIVPNCWTTIPATFCNRSLKSFTVATLL